MGLSPRDVREATHMKSHYHGYVNKDATSGQMDRGKTTRPQLYTELQVTEEC